MSRGSSTGHDRHITVFSPEGRLYQVEYAFKAVNTPGLTCIGVKGKDTACLVIQKKIPDKLLVPRSVTNLYAVSAQVGAAMVGPAADGRALVMKAREQAGEFELKHGYPIPVHFLAQKVANYNQFYTQFAAARPLAVVSLFIAIDDESGPCLFKVDPAGFSAGYKASSAGLKEREATNWLNAQMEKNEAAFSDMSYSKTVQTAVEALQQILGVDFKAAEIEVGVVTVDTPRFRLLSEAEVDEHMTAIAEQD